MNLRAWALGLGLLGMGACGIELNENECANDGDCARLKPGTVCSPENWCVVPGSIEPDANRPPPRADAGAGGAGGAGGGAGGAGGIEDVDAGGAGGAGGAVGDEGVDAEAPPIDAGAPVPDGSLPIEDAAPAVPDADTAVPDAESIPD